MVGSGHLKRNSQSISWPKWSWTWRTNNSAHGYCPSKCTTWLEEGIIVSIDETEFRREKLFVAATTSASTFDIDICHFSLPSLMIWTTFYKLRWQHFRWHLYGTLYGSKPLQWQFDQHQWPLIQNDRYGMNATDLLGSANFYNIVTSGRSMMSTQNLNPISLQSISKTNSTLTPNHSNLHNAQQVVHMKPQSIGQSKNMNFQSPLSSRENILQPHRQQQF